jgi:hypothetical protein
MKDARYAGRYDCSAGKEKEKDRAAVSSAVRGSLRREG